MIKCMNHSETFALNYRDLCRCDYRILYQKTKNQNTRGREIKTKKPNFQMTKKLEYKTEYQRSINKRSLRLNFILWPVCLELIGQYQRAVCSTLLPSFYLIQSICETSEELQLVHCITRRYHQFQLPLSFQIVLTLF